MKREKGLLIVLSGPSGVGKGTVRKELFAHKELDLQYSISMTTRQPRAGEVDGVDYFFRTKETFQTLIEQNELLEWAEFVGNYYGTPIKNVRNSIDLGKDIFLEIEVQGALQVKKSFPEGVFIFLAPPSLSELRKRIEARGTESQDVIDNRLLMAKEEIEMMDVYDYVVENDTVENACERIKAIVMSENCKRERIAKIYKKLMEV
jgi:guanylate kinase